LRSGAAAFEPPLFFSCSHEPGPPRPEHQFGARSIATA
jgi:hypothetical protein